MELKFKIGDKISAKLLTKPTKRFIVIVEDIIFGEETINKYWFGHSKCNMEISNSYIVRDINHPWYYYISFRCQDEFNFYENILN
jgi:hypothetical protein